MSKTSAEREVLEGLRRGGDAGEREQVAHQRLHPGRRVGHEVDVLLAFVVEVLALLVREQGAERPDLAQRLLQVVGGDVGELFQLLVGAGEVAGVALQRLLRLLLLGDVAHDPHDPHGRPRLVAYQDGADGDGEDRPVPCGCIPSRTRRCSRAT